MYNFINSKVLEDLRIPLVIEILERGTVQEAIKLRIFQRHALIKSIQLVNTFGVNPQDLLRVHVSFPSEIWAIIINYKLQIEADPKTVIIDRDMRCHYRIPAVISCVMREIGRKQSIIERDVVIKKENRISFFFDAIRKFKSIERRAKPLVNKIYPNPMVLAYDQYKGKGSQWHWILDYIKKYKPSTWYVGADAVRIAQWELLAETLNAELSAMFDNIGEQFHLFGLGDYILDTGKYHCNMVEYYKYGQIFDHKENMWFSRKLTYIQERMEAPVRVLGLMRDQFEDLLLNPPDGEMFEDNPFVKSFLEGVKLTNDVLYESRKRKREDSYETDNVKMVVYNAMHELEEKELSDTDSEDEEMVDIE